MIKDSPDLCCHGQKTVGCFECGSKSSSSQQPTAAIWCCTTDHFDACATPQLLHQSTTHNIADIAPFQQPMTDITTTSEKVLTEVSKANESTEGSTLFVSNLTRCSNILFLGRPPLTHILLPSEISNAAICLKYLVHTEQSRRLVLCFSCNLNII